MNVAGTIARSACRAIRRATCFGNGSYLGAVLTQGVRYGVAERKGNAIRVKKGQEYLVEQAFSLLVDVAPLPKQFDGSTLRSSNTKRRGKRKVNMAKKTSPKHSDFLAACNTVARQRLLNRRIVEVRYLTADECRRLMWNRSSVVLVLDDGTSVYAARDAEGNDAGSLHGVSGSGEEFVLPELNV